MNRPHGHGYHGYPRLVPTASVSNTASNNNFEQQKKRSIQTKRISSNIEGQTPP